MEQENNNTFTPQNQQPVEPTEPAQPPQAAEAAAQPAPVVAQQVEQPVFQPETLQPSPVATSPVAEPKKSGGLVYGIIGLALGIISYVLPYTTFLFSSSSYSSDSGDSIKIYFAASLILSVAGLILSIVALKKSERVSVTGLAGFTLNLLSIMTGATQMLLVLSIIG